MTSPTKSQLDRAAGRPYFALSGKQLRAKLDLKVTPSARPWEDKVVIERAEYELKARDRTTLQYRRERAIADAEWDRLHPPCNCGCECCS